MLGSAAPNHYIYNFWFDQYEHTLSTSATPRTGNDFAVHGSLQEGKLVGFYLLAGVVQVAVGFDRGGDPEHDRDSEMAPARASWPAPIAARSSTSAWTSGR